MSFKYDKYFTDFSKLKDEKIFEGKISKSHIEFLKKVGLPKMVSTPYGKIKFDINNIFEYQNETGTYFIFGTKESFNNPFEYIGINLEDNFIYSTISDNFKCFWNSGFDKLLKFLIIHEFTYDKILNGNNRLGFNYIVRDNYYRIDPIIKMFPCDTWEGYIFDVCNTQNWTYSEYVERVLNGDGKLECDLTDEEINNLF